MQINDWENAQRLSDTTSKKWARCSDCDKWKKTSNIRIIDNMNLCKRCFKKRIEEFSENKKEPEEEIMEELKDVKISGMSPKKLQEAISPIKEDEK